MPPRALGAAGRRCEVALGPGLHSHRKIHCKTIPTEMSAMSHPARFLLVATTTMLALAGTAQARQSHHAHPSHQ